MMSLHIPHFYIYNNDTNLMFRSGFFYKEKKKEVMRSYIVLLMQEESLQQWKPRKDLL